MDKFKFSVEKNNEISKLLIDAINRHIKIKSKLYDQNIADQELLSKRQSSLIAKISIFIKLTELDIDILNRVGRYQISLNWISSQLAERFSSMFEIKPTPARNNDFSKILLICFECASVVKCGKDEHVDVYRYAKQGIDAIATNKRDTYKLLTGVERKIVEAKDNADLKKSRDLVLKKKMSIKVKKGGVL